MLRLTHLLTYPTHSQLIELCQAGLCKDMHRRYDRYSQSKRLEGAIQVVIPDPLAGGIRFEL